MPRLRRIEIHGGGLYGYEFICPGCAAFAKANPNPLPFDVDETRSQHLIPTTGPKAWGFNGDLERPTFTPSIVVFEYKRPSDGWIYQPRCHTFVTDGRIQYLGDCGHSFAGQTVDLPEIVETR